MSVTTVAVSPHVWFNPRTLMYEFKELNLISDPESGDSYSVVTVGKEKIEDVRAFQESAWKNGAKRFYTHQVEW